MATLPFSQNFGSSNIMLRWATTVFIWCPVLPYPVPRKVKYIRWALGGNHPSSGQGTSVSLLDGPTTRATGRGQALSCRHPLLLLGNYIKSA